MNDQGRWKSALYGLVEGSFTVKAYLQDLLKDDNSENKTKIRDEVDFELVFRCKSCQAIFEAYDQLKIHIEESLSCQVKCSPDEDLENAIRVTSIKQELDDDNELRTPYFMDDLTIKEIYELGYEGTAIHNSLNEEIDKSLDNEETEGSEHETSFEKDHDVSSVAERIKKKKVPTAHLPKKKQDKTCTSCKKTFRYVRSYKKHLLSCAGEVTLDYECSQCNKGFASRHSLANHMRIHQKGQKKIKKPKPVYFVCPVCRKRFISQERLDVHAIVHDVSQVDRSKGMWTCKVCDRSYKHLRGLQLHMDLHKDPKKITCEVCNKIFMNSDIKRRHMSIHTGQKPVICDVCGKRFRNKSLLGSHRYVHNRICRYKCDVCGKGFGHSNAYRTHYLIHTKERPYICSMCGASFNKKAALTSHEGTHVEKPFKCKLCTRAFVTSSDLEAHTESHDTVRHFKRIDEELKKFPCEICGKKMMTKTSLTHHVKIHSDTRPHVCDVCGAGFRQKAALSRHKLKHNNSFLMHCLLCGESRGFNRKEHLIRHMKTHGVDNYYEWLRKRKISQSTELSPSTE